MARPDLTTVPVFYHRYIAQITEESVSEAIRNNTQAATSFLNQIPEARWEYRYAEGKWTIKEMLQHIIDTERIFAFRALCFSRGESQSLPGFEENDYAAASRADRRPVADLLEEFATVRKSIEQLFASFDDAHISGIGIANNNPISVNAIGFIIPGHVQHHLNVLQERYL